MSENHSNLNIKPLVGNTTPTIVEVNATEETPSNVSRLLPSATEATDVNLNLNRTQTWSTAGPTSQRSVRVQAPTLASTAATTIATAATVEIDKAPVAGTNVTITTPLALNIAQGKTRFGTSTSSSASFNMPQGTAPTSPVDGDWWYGADGMYFQSNGQTIGPISGTVGNFICATSQTNQTLDENSATDITFDTEEWANGIAISGAKLVIANEGVYNVWFSANPKHTAGGSETITVWLMLDGVEVDNSTRQTPISGNNEFHPFDVTFTIKTTQPNSPLKVMATATDTDITFTQQNAITTPYVAPATPSCSIVVAQVVDSSIFISGAINLDGGAPDSVYGGTTLIDGGTV